MGNTTTPTRYYFVAENTCYPEQSLSFQADRRNQSDANQPGDAADLVDDARVANAPLGQASVFTGTLGYADVEDWYKLNVAAGSIVTVTVSHLNPVDGRIDVAFQDQDKTGLDSDTCSRPRRPGVFVYMGNNTVPSAYYLHMVTGGGNPLLRYRFRVGRLAGRCWRRRGCP